ncbi:hypothetical protein [Wolbachia endosymbiont of Nilaparvata lugens]|uniref:hypothetical protein n=1 Tax=Wolbachia endosymbiont of Nilaparvata lugens TaxID=357143 RepID=UPI00117C6242|nr:hypothetical protein [Wolbachia endosymbiont of Nilaparvata lugens]
MDDDTKAVLFLSGIATSIGALTGLALSFTTLSPLVMGGIVAAVPVTLLFAYSIVDQIKEGSLSKQGLFLYACWYAASTAVGVGLAAAATAISSSIMLGMGSSALAGAIIAPIAFFAGAFAIQHIIQTIAEKVSEYIISPIIEKVGKCFSSKEEDGLVR